MVDLNVLTRFERRMKWVAYALVALVVVAALMTASKADAQTNTVSFNLETTISADRTTLTPKLTWSTTPAATTCTASGHTSWAATPNRGPSGEVTLPSFPATEPRGYFLLCNWPGDTQAALTWVPPTTFEPYDHDNNPATPNVQDPLPKCATSTDTGACLTGYMIEFGTTSLNQSRFHMFPQSTTATVTGLTSGSTYQFAIRALTGQGAQSVRSNTVSKSLPAGVQVSQSAGIRVPSAPTLN